jgi:hypothetical protein
MIIKPEEVRGYALQNAMFCFECAPKDIGDLKFDNIITHEELEDTEDMFFCDRCGKQL